MMRLAGALIVLVALSFVAPTMAQPDMPGPAPAPTLAQPSQPAPPSADKPAENNSPPAPSTSGEPTENKPPQASTAPAATQHSPTADDICRALEQDAAENQLPVEFFARVIWQESRFNAQAVSSKGAQGIAQFMPGTADFRGLADPFDPIAALKSSADYLRELKDKFGNLGLAAAGYNAGPGRVSEWLAGRRGLPSETRNYVAIITGWTADEWAAPKPPQTSETTIPQGIPCARLANLILAPQAERQRIAAYVPAWGMQLTADWSESKAWASYRSLQKRFAALIGDREPIVRKSRTSGMGAATRFEIRIADDSRAYLENFCKKLIAAGGACVVLRNNRG
jgi:Transglycosylase SLT domain